MLSFFLTLYRFVRAFVGALKDQEFRALLIVVVILVASSTVFYSAIEGWTIVDSIYFSVITLTTIGYGDMHPTTMVSKIFTIFYVLIGVGVFVAFLSKLAANAVKKQK